MPELNYIEVKQWISTFFIANCKSNGPLKDPRVRQALWKSIDRPTQTDTVWNGVAWNFVGPFLPGLDWALPDKELSQVMGYDPQGAKQLIQAATGQSTLTLQVEQANISNQNAAYEFCQANMKQAGITLNTNVIDANKFLTYKAQGGFQDLTWGAFAYASTNGDLNARWRTGGSQNGAGLSDPDLDAMIDKQATLVKDEAGRRSLLLDIQRKVAQDASYIQNLGYVTPSVNWPNLHNYIIGNTFESGIWEQMWLS
jgi:peptide/nickel transport system substrate-binding protein